MAFPDTTNNRTLTQMKTDLTDHVGKSNNTVATAQDRKSVV